MIVKKMVLISLASLLLAGCSGQGVQVEEESTSTTQTEVETSTVIDSEARQIEATETESSETETAITAQEPMPNSIFTQPPEVVWIEPGDAAAEEQLNLVEQSDEFNIEGQPGRVLIYSYAQFGADGQLGFEDSGEWAAVAVIGDKKYVLMPKQIHYWMGMTGIVYQTLDEEWHALITLHDPYWGYHHYDFVYNKEYDAFRLNYEVEINTGMNRSFPTDTHFLNVE